MTACASSLATSSIPIRAQTPGMDRKAAINFARVGAQKIWAGTVTIKPDAKTGAHHHGHLESIIYVVRGKARMRWGEQLQFTAEASPGDFIYRAALRAASGDQRQPRRGSGMRAGAQRRRGGRDQSRHRAGREAGDRALGRSDPSRLTVLIWRGYLVGSSAEERS